MSFETTAVYSESTFILPKLNSVLLQRITAGLIKELRTIGLDNLQTKARKCW